MNLRNRSITPTSRCVLAALLAATAFGTAHSIARADCAAPLPEVLWSYPADGARDVPTDAVIWTLATGWRTPVNATLNGESLDVPDGGPGGTAIDPGPLEADTEYLLRLEYDEGAGLINRKIAFRTGARAQGEQPKEPIVEGHQTSRGFDSHACGAVIESQDCFDTGQDTLVEFDVSSKDAVAWLVTSDQGSTLWPAGCGKPALFVHRDSLDCADLRALGSDGQLSGKTTYCLSSGGSQPQPATDCSVAYPGARATAAWPAAAALALLALFHRARRRR